MGRRDQEMTESKHFAFKHYQLPVTIIWKDPEEYFVKGMKTILRDIEENGTERWTVTSLTKNIPTTAEEKFEV